MLTPAMHDNQQVRLCPLCPNPTHGDEPFCRPCLMRLMTARHRDVPRHRCACVCGCSASVTPREQVHAIRRCAGCRQTPGPTCWRPRGTQVRKQRPLADFSVAIIDRRYARARYCQRTHQPLPVELTL